MQFVPRLAFVFHVGFSLSRERHIFYSLCCVMTPLHQKKGVFSLFTCNVNHTIAFRFNHESSRVYSEFPGAKVELLSIGDKPILYSSFRL